MAVAPGTRIGPFEVVAKLGEGGMGEVYRARDTKLDRDVALKILPESFASDPDRLMRFEREAKTLAVLNHPNIAAIYGIEESESRVQRPESHPASPESGARATRALVMELVEGEDLARRIVRGAVPLQEALPIAAQIAEALDAAHQRGIVHRDLKPGNVMVTETGVVKVLDFGLAKALDPSTMRPGDNAATENPGLGPLDPGPTMTSPAMTQAGLILGTASYMSPEQARGKPVDKRSDIFSFGCVLYEMLTGHRPFGGETVGDAIGAVLHKDADFDRLPPKVPDRVRRVLSRCLERDLHRRYRDIGDVLHDLQADDGDATAPVGPGDVPPRRAAALALATFALGALLMAAFTGFSTGGDSALAPGTKRFGLTGVAMPLDSALSIALSPDGTYLALRVADSGGTQQIHLRALDSTTLEPVPGSESGWLPFFSPDSRSLAFFSGNGLLVAPVDRATAARRLADAPAGISGGAWTSKNQIVVSGTGAGELYLVSPSSGDVTRVPVAASPDRDIIAVGSALPDGDAVLASVRHGVRWDVSVVSLVDGSMHVVAENGFSPVYSASGHILFQQGQTGPLMALPFDAARRMATAAPFLAVEGGDAPRTSFQVRPYDIAADGTLAFVPASFARIGGSLVWVDRAGARETIADVGRTVDIPRLSHDGTRIAYRTLAPNCDIWMYDLARGAATRVTTAGDNHGVAWSADDNHIATFRRDQVDGRALWIRADGAGDAAPMHPDAVNEIFLVSVSADGQRGFVLNRDPASGYDISVIDTATGTIAPVLQSRFNETGATLSPDGTLLAYVSDESGQREVYVQTFPALDSRVKVSIDGGYEPRWSRRGGRLYYRAGNGLLEATIQTTPRLAAGKPHTLFEGRYGTNAPGVASYDVTADDARFVMIEQQPVDPSVASVEILVNWFGELTRLEQAAGPRR